MTSDKSLKRDLAGLLVLFIKMSAFAVCALCYFVIMGQKVWSLLSISRTSGITLLAFALTYLFMTRMYGGMDIGKRKSKPILYTMIISLLFTDLAANLFLSIMVTTPLHEGVFTFESPLFLLLVYVSQLLMLTGITYGGQAWYFSLMPPARCLVVTAPDVDVEAFMAGIERYKKQYEIAAVVDVERRDLPLLIKQVDAVFFCGLSAEERAEAVLYCYRKQKDIYYSMELEDIVSMRGRAVTFDDKSFWASPASFLSPGERFVKRLADILFSGLALILTSPVFLVTAIAIKREDGGPVFYKQRRANYSGHSFEVLKFRSMRVEDGSIHRSVTKDDDRITKVGHVIRKYRIDELPQLINIIKSDMSLVGPRPEMLENVEQYTAELPEFAYRLRVKAGLTGLAQIYGKYNTSPKDKLLLDLTYIEQFSIWLDLKLLFRTVLVLFTPDESTAAFENDDEEESDE